MAKTPTDFLDHLENDTLEDLFLCRHPEHRGEKLRKKTILDDMSGEVEELGAKGLFQIMKREDLKKLSEGVNSIAWKNDDNRNSKTVLIKKLASAAEEQGIHDFLSEHADSEQLKSMAVVLDLEPADKKEELVQQVSGGTIHLGLEGYLSSFNVDTLQDVAEDLKLKTHHSNNKRKLIEAIINKEDVEREPKKKQAKVEFSKKKKPIQKGVTYEDIFQHYYVGEVREYCKEKGLKTSGKKGVLIKRILAYLGGDEDSTKSSGKGGKKSKAPAAKEEKAQENGGGEEEEEEEPKQTRGTTESRTLYQALKQAQEEEQKKNK